jgi:endonuclease/exonuclease/phosphatase family metal-dependent hydrolase
VNWVVTHLEAQSGDCRVKQIDELASFLRRYADGNPTVVMGDFNIHAEDHKAYVSLRDTLKIDSARLRDAWEELRGSSGGTSEPLTNDGGDRIDYILYSSGRGECRIRISDVNIRQLRNRRVGSLSDHAAVEETFIVD